MLADLHVHTTASDGAWSVEEVVRAAASRRVQLLAITDHDETKSIAEGLEFAKRFGVSLVPGIEISANWRDVSIHVVGLNLDPDATSVKRLVAQTKAMRANRAKEMAQALELAGIADAYEGALRFADSAENLSRTHFARYIVQQGICATTGEVFARFMKPGKPGYVPTEWSALEDAVKAIRDAGGDAVLAHPARYDLQWVGGIRELIDAFKSCGGAGLEVICSAHTPADWSVYGGYCRSFGLKASIGSDFHSPRESRIAIGDLPRLPGSLTPIWSDWSIAHA